MARLPCYIIIDTSGSMAGAPINAINQALSTFQSALKGNPAIREVAWVSVITFNQKATQILPLTAVDKMQIPVLTAESVTNYGTALSMLLECIRNEVVRTRTETLQPDYKPLVFFFTDGEPTDEGQWEPVAARLKQHKIDKEMHCFIAGNSNEAAARLKVISDNVYQIADTTPDRINALFKLVTNSLVFTTQSIQSNPNAGQNIVAAGPLPPGIVMF